jgi:hypothetical protein
MAEASVGALACVVTFVMLVLIDQSSRVAPDPVDGTAILRHGVAFRTIAGSCKILFGLGFAYATADAIASGFDGAGSTAVLTLGGFFALGVWMVREGRRTFVLDADGIHYGARDGATRTLAWQDVRAVEYSLVRECITLRDARGGSVAIRRYMQGLDQLWARLEQHVEPGIWSAARAKLHGRGGPRQDRSARS